MDFEFDPAKSLSNLSKHGIDFIDAQALWQHRYQTALPTHFVPEDRKLMVAVIDGRMWTAVFTMRDDTVRLISVRRARPTEVMSYERGKTQTH
ncbi:BrnT family toxin [Sandaracinobacteroides saxicola]|uniref:BrnT family toxin n=1 Tax=Sandaracinobacteroides saxicola TaxID=2759707 RepID=A0A7G5IFN1_9SPHN|nr:BrnT family toxin [Sandaracinobacteroides saxicola]QMW22173.1 BrnT family toxin [Sandaracinobacteroides saxicola]